MAAGSALFPGEAPAAHLRTASSAVATDADLDEGARRLSGPLSTAGG